MADPTIDLDTFKELQTAAGEEFVRELVDTFLQEAPLMLTDLRDALATGNAVAFRRAAHSLKSNSQTFGALGLGAMARELELKGFGDATPLGLIDQEYACVAAALTGLRDA